MPVEIEYSRVYRVLLNNLPPGRRPKRNTIQSLTTHLPNAVIIGFGYYDFYRLWYFLVYSPTFPVNLWSTASNLTWAQATGSETPVNTPGVPPAV